jgi:hypothetical protein
MYSVSKWIASMASKRKHLIVFLAWLVMTSCSADRPNAPTSGIPTSIPEVDLRIDGHEHDLVPITWLGVSPTGQIALIQWQDHNVRIFDASGAPLGSVGREGEGPGEFRRPVRGGWSGDTLWVSDPQINRITLISPSLEVLGTFAPPPIVRPPPEHADTISEYRSPFPYAVHNRDTLLVSALDRTDRRQINPAIGFPILKVTASGAILQQITRIPMDPGLGVTIQLGGGRVASGLIPYFPRSDWVVAPNGRRLAILTTDMPDSSAPSYRVRVFDASGRVLVDQTFPFDPVPIPQAKLDSAIQAAAARRPDVRSDLEAALRQAARTIYPEAERILLGSDNRIWIGLRATDQGRRWLVLDPDGTPTERYLLPGNVLLRAASETHIWAVERDEFDVESVVRYRLR